MTNRMTRSRGSRRWWAIAGLAAVLGVGAAVSTWGNQPPAGVVEATVSDDKNEPIEDAVVFLPLAATRPAGALSAPAPSTAVMDQFDREFIPHVLPVLTGAAVSFPNRDNIRHHVYSFSAPKKFELPLYIGTPSAPVVFDKPGIVALGCNIHDWMVGYVFVLATPHFARTGPDGRARIPEVPSGSYEARAWHPRMRGAPEGTTKTVVVGAGEPGQAKFVLSLKRRWRPPRGPGRYEGPQPSG